MALRLSSSGTLDRIEPPQPFVALPPRDPTASSDPSLSDPISASVSLPAASTNTITIAAAPATDAKMPSSTAAPVPLSPDEAALATQQRQFARSQIALPISLLVFIITSLLSSLVAKPTMAEVSELYLTVMTPATKLIGLYWLVIASLLVGQAILLGVGPAGSQPILVEGVGLRLAFVNLLMSAWIGCFVLRFFLVAQIILLVVLIMVFSMWATLLRFPPVASRPFDFTFIHMPIRMFLAILLQVDVWQGGLLALRYYRHPAKSGHHPSWEAAHSTHGWIMFAIIIVVALINAAEVFYLRDFVFAASCIYLVVAETIQSEGKSAQIWIALVLAAVMVGVSLLSSVGWSMLKHDREGAIRLADEEEVARA
ncbi:BZ3500_MvSof-1268-A1-R1_Chr8-1g10033 [Microbotryum saponariae]|uniref:BZ3500_MvSof-1268-A1-R1_Chr8-1g10033 protein n=1 Tax=Microbotryum saponariae TaxID=289078 RepID=A0A2X0LJ64_9BASI|nr:BZ3500_MvSof-1268-A1-R1_Chr8-1g10033 [Microbotryum saponariae]SDA08319.1 BZ3501_MvSof-1269-A2-R1_Chr8-1g09756 [Microbotryum saponariae]